MKSSRSIKILLIILIIFFGLKFLSEILFNRSTSGSGKADPVTLKLSNSIFPLSSKTNILIGNSFLENFKESEDENLLSESILRFKKAIRLNRLNFHAYFSMAKAYMSLETGDPTNFENSLKALKAASGIRPTNLKINFETLKIFVSLWPFLNMEDRSWSGDLLKNIILRLNNKQFKEIIETWGLYSRDPKFINYAINQSCRFYKEIVKELVKQELNLKLRQRFIADLENRSLIDYENKFKEAQSRGGIPFSSYIRVNRSIKFYHKFASEVRFHENNYNNLKKEINLYIIKKIILKEGEKDRVSLYKYIGYYLNDFGLIRDIEDLYHFLRTKNFFNSNDLRTFYLKQLISFKTGQITKMINETEGFRQSVTFVKEGQEKDLAKLLTLLVDGYMNSRLLTKAIDILKDIEKISPGLMSTYWRLMKIESVIGEDEFFADKKEEHFEKINNSSNILINNKNIKTPVFPYKIDKIVLIIDEAYSEKFREFHLLQVFLNGRIFHESYIEQLEFPIELALPEEFKKVKFEVEIKLVK